MALSLDWIRCEGNNWCNLLELNLDNNHFEGLEGVYIIWHGEDNPATVKVGQGIIRDRLSAHRQDFEILEYSGNGLYATWARVAEDYRDGVERYLGERLDPIVGIRLPDTEPIEVNLPW